MIKSFEQAKRIQEARFKAHKRGYAKAVCRYFKRVNTFHGKLNNSLFRDSLESLPVKR